MARNNNRLLTTETDLKQSKTVIMNETLSNLIELLIFNENQTKQHFYRNPADIFTKSTMRTPEQCEKSVQSLL